MSTLDAASLPRGADDCLSGETFVLTGTLPHLSRRVSCFAAALPLFAEACVRREDADALIKRHGGRVTGSVTGKTTFVLVRARGASQPACSAESGPRDFADSGGRRLRQ